jgi:hypothetical protein
MGIEDDTLADSTPNASGREQRPDAHDPLDELVHQLFTVSLDLHSALPLVRDENAAGMIRGAIDELDHAVTHLRNAVHDGPLAPEARQQAIGRSAERQFPR